MIAKDTGEYNGMACVWLNNGSVRLAATTDRGPRIIFWGWQDGKNLFAELPNAVIPTPHGGYSLLGGHRLWYAPEVMSSTYLPDNAPLSVKETSGGVAFTAPADAAGIVKEMAVAMAEDEAEVTVTHTLRNEGPTATQLAPWGISMCRLGGTAILPQPRERTDPDGFLPNRHFSFWPYSNISDERLTLGNRVSMIRATAGPNNKIGYRNSSGWFAYQLEGTLFSKHFDPQLDGDHPDGGCNAEFFFAQDAIELETLGPLVQLEPGSEVSHVETWRLHESPSPLNNEADAEALEEMIGRAANKT